MFAIKYHADKNMLTIGARVWAFVRTRPADDYDYDNEGYPTITAYRVFVLHAWRFHVIAEWRM